MSARRRLFVPEVLQSSGMDCGPAVLKSLLAGFGVHASYPRLREACQTGVDGTSIDTLEDVARELGFDARQVLVSPERLERPAELAPAIAVLRQPNGTNHFVLLWRARGGWVQVMDPATGRRWMRGAAFRAAAYEHAMAVPADSWRRWAGTPAFREPLERRLRALGLRAAGARVERAAADPTWRALATLDAAERMARSLVQSGALRRGRAAGRLVEELADEAAAEDPRASATIPAAYWEARPGAPGPDGEAPLHVRGAVLVRIRGADELRRADQAASEELAPELAAALQAPPLAPSQTLLRTLLADGRAAPLAAAGGIALAAVVVLVQALLLRSLLDLHDALASPAQRLGAFGLLVAFLVAAAALELSIVTALFRMGRKLEGRLRVALQAKLPRLATRAFHSIPSSDMAERAHSLLVLRGVAPVLGRLLRAAFQLLLTTAGLVWLDPRALLPAVCAALAAVAVPLAFQRSLGERELRVRSHRGALARFYLDALLGLVPARVHGASRSLRREHEGLLSEWVRAGRRLLGIGLVIEGLQALIGFGLAAWLVVGHLGRGGEAGGVLLFAYWALGLPALGEELARLALQYPGQRNAARRALEPLSGSEEDDPAASVAPASERSTDELPARGAGQLAAAGTGVAPPPSALRPVGVTEPAAAAAVAGARVELRGVGVRAGGHDLLRGVDLTLAAGEHVAVVGHSGAGKSTLVGLLLGGHRPAAGELCVDGLPLEGAALAALRRATAWVDPEARLWNRSLLANVRYGSAPAAAARAGEAVAAAELGEALERLPDGLQSTLGEGGGLLSGGEGQRVRLARAFLREGVRLALLDEPFRGLDRGRRRELLARSRERWRDATLLCVSHDVGAALDFDRVLVIEQGELVEDGAPRELAARPGSRFGVLLEEERTLLHEVWRAPYWRRLRMERGRLAEEGPR
ncbi:MAG: ATP-binding cassette domain-containing protein [Planctomycetota bacterium]